MTVADILEEFERGVTEFHEVHIDAADFRGLRMPGIRFFDSSFPRANFDDANLEDVWFYLTSLPIASFENANLNEARLVDVDLSGARLRSAELGYAHLNAVDLTHADLMDCDLSGTHLIMTNLRGANLNDIGLGETAFSDVDVTPFCDATGLLHEGPSFVDLRSVLRSCYHPGLKRFMVDCGVPPLVAEYTIDAAKAEGGALESLMRSTFISYGGPDEPFARRLYEELRAHGVTTFFFPETARLGRRIGEEVHSRIQEHDRVILVCSRESLNRLGVRNEIQETFDREARDGGATYLLPIMLDDFVLTGWADSLAERVRGRVVGDFRGALADDRAFDGSMSRLLAALRKDPR